MRNFKDLKAWKAGVELAVQTHQYLETRSQRSMWAIADQMRRASLSIPNNIAEGFGRDTAPDRRQFVIRARGSLQELETSLLVGKRLGFRETEELDEQIELTGKLLNGLIRFLDRWIREHSPSRRPTKTKTEPPPHH
ncbi:MAG: four helix bundle protein [Thermoanaerobaculia bacterium]